MRVLKLTLAYDGSSYAGWQVQPDAETIQGVLERTLHKITGETIRVTGSGRTDAGVHAEGQVASFSTNSALPDSTFRRALNAELPEDIAVVSVKEAGQEFHARRDAVRKRYRYSIRDATVRDVFERRYCWQYPQPLDADAMARASRALIGTHDFSSFESSGAPRQTSVRTVHDLRVIREPEDQIEIEIEANGFLYNMVRAIVGTLVEVGRGAQDEAYVERVLRATDRAVAGPTAPAQGLCLIKVDYETP